VTGLGLNGRLCNANGKGAAVSRSENGGREKDRDEGRGTRDEGRGTRDDI
jgi:hypothetical protein